MGAAGLVVLLGVLGTLGAYWRTRPRSEGDKIALLHIDTRFPWGRAVSAMLRILHHSGDGQYLCPICNEPVTLNTAKADEDGHAVHEDCYLDKISCKIPAAVRKPPARQS